MISKKVRYILGSILLIFLSVSFVRSTFKVIKSSGRLDEVNEEVRDLEAEKTRLEKEIEYKSTEEYIEEKARNELNLVKPGEKVYVVTGTKQGGITNEENVLSSQNEVSGMKDSNYYMWYRLFFDN